MNKLERYRNILIKTIEKFWDTRKPIYKYQEVRIWQMLNKEYIDVYILDNYTVKHGKKRAKR